ncbi:hypothetical protein RhiLY_02755 [Ceratobasidium sp. AG-Ba]|nr:hypothetical protein RhiLY_02755 [Ceratobasidium sp. AG-Ba]
MTSSTPDQISSPSSRAMSLFEIADLVASFSTRHVCVRLAQTSGVLCTASVPYIWAYVEDARNLFRLLPTMIEDDSDHGFSWTKIYLENLQDGHFGIFSAYAPHVKILDVYGRSREYYEVSYWRYLIERARERPLLPNLRALIIASDKRLVEREIASDQAAWAGAFASPSLLEFTVAFCEEGYASGISYAAASFILEILAQRSPKLQTLGLLVDNDKGDEEENGESAFLVFFTTRKFESYLSIFADLRHVSGTAAWFHDQPFQKLGELPHLETLTVYRSFDVDYGKIDSWRNRKNLFPALHSLTLSNLYKRDAKFVLSRGAALFKNLTFLHLSLYQEFRYDNSLDGEQLILLLPSLREAVHLMRLELAVDSQTKNYMFDKSGMDVFSKLPLLELSLKPFYLSENAINMDLGAVWALLTRLEMPTHRASLADLSRFATIPCLNYLELFLDLQLNDTQQTNTIHQTELTRLVASPGSTITSDPDEIQLVVHFLASAWPNLSSVTWSQLDKPEAEQTQYRVYADNLNYCISELHSAGA